MIGRVIAKCLIDGLIVSINLSRTFLKHILSIYLIFIHKKLIIMYLINRNSSLFRRFRRY